MATAATSLAACSDAVRARSESAREQALLVDHRLGGGRHAPGHVAELGGGGGKIDGIMLDLLADRRLAPQPLLAVVARLDFGGEHVVGAHGVPQHGQRARYVADLVGAVGLVHVDLGVARGEIDHLARDQLDRRGNGGVHRRHGDAEDQQGGKHRADGELDGERIRRVMRERQHREGLSGADRARDHREVAQMHDADIGRRAHEHHQRQEQQLTHDQSGAKRKIPHEEHPILWRNV